VAPILETLAQIGGLLTKPGRKQTCRGGGPLPARTPWLAASVLFVVVGLGIYSAAFRGPFLADDIHYIPQNPYVTDPSAARLLEVLDPTGQPVVLVHNYSPVHLLLHNTCPPISPIRVSISSWMNWPPVR